MYTPCLSRQQLKRLETYYRYYGYSTLPKNLPSVGAQYIVQKGTGFSFNMTNPLALEAASRINYHFSDSTNEMATMALNRAKVELRRIIREGLEQGMPYSEVARRVREIYDNPYIAFRIAVTETARATEAGSLISAQIDSVQLESQGLKLKKEWLASSDACDLCLELGDMEEIELDKPFYVHPKGGPYSVIMHPPAHPFCGCSINYVLSSL